MMPFVAADIAIGSLVYSRIKTSEQSNRRLGEIFCELSCCIQKVFEVFCGVNVLILGG